MARLFSQASGTDAVDLGSPTPLDNLVQSGFTLIFIAGRRTGNQGNQGLFGKSGALTTRGITFFSDNSATPNATFGHLRAVVGTNATPYIRSSNASDTNVDTMILNQQEVIACQFSTTFTDGFQFYRNPIQTPIQEVASYFDESAGTGTIGADGADNAFFGLAPALGAFPFTGDLGFCLVYNRGTVYSVADLQRIQLGVVTYLAALEAGASTARAVAIWQSVSGYKLLGYLSSAGTFTDHSGNSITGTLTGTSAGVNDVNWFAPTAFDDDKESAFTSDLREQVHYRYTCGFARKTFFTAATGFTAWDYRTLDGFYDNQAGIAYMVNDTYTGLIGAGTDVGQQSGAVSGLPAYGKTITFVNGARSAATPTRPYEGTFLQAVRFTAAATEIAPTTRNTALVMIGDSVLEGFLLVPPHRDQPLQRLRLNGFNGTNVYDGVIDHAAGGMELFDIAGDSTKRAEYTTILTSGNPKRILIQLAANDFFVDRTIANFTTWLDTLCDNILAVGGFTGKITLCTVTDWRTPPEGDTNANGDNIEDFRQAVRDVVTSQATARVSLCEIGAGLLNPLTDIEPSDGVHLLIGAVAKLVPRYYSATAALDFVPGTATKGQFDPELIALAWF